MAAGQTPVERAAEFGITLDVSSPDVVRATYKGFTAIELATPVRPAAGQLLAMFSAVNYQFFQPNPPPAYDQALVNLILFLYKIESYALALDTLDAQIRQFKPRSSAPPELLAQYDSLDRKAVRFPAFRDEAEALYQAVKAAQ